ncbi:MAG TPA: alpha-hydroxy acid oxidase [Gemmatimonadaceae bacterium]|nr:alpha-hydroxy acid oxidase [Gemmatimonadaceae bacterium]
MDARPDTAGAARAAPADAAPAVEAAPGAFANLREAEALARSRLPRDTYDYFAGGANDEVTLRENEAAWGRVALRYRVLTGAGPRDLSTTVLGQPVALPVLIAPTAYQRLAHPEGELATARAADAAGTVMVLSTLATTAVEVVRSATRQPLWFQLYIYRDRGATSALVERAEAAGCDALVLTVDAPVLGRRERDVRNRFHLPMGVDVGHAVGTGLHAPPTTDDSRIAQHFAEQMDDALSWRDVEWLRGMTQLPVVVKGVVRGDDARLAAYHGAAAVVVSNHGGRQLDTAVATARALPEVVDALAGRCEVLVDGGVRRGTDVVKALAYGARAVMLGRPVLWGLAAGGEAGVRRVLSLLGEELDRALALCGCATPARVGRDLLG